MRAINWLSPQEWRTCLTTYATHTREVDENIYNLYVYVVRTRGKAIIGMALRAIVINRIIDLIFYQNSTFLPSLELNYHIRKYQKTNDLEYVDIHDAGITDSAIHIAIKE